MLYSNDRGKMRDVFFNAWRKHLNRTAVDRLEPMEQMIVEVIERHPEYHAILADPEANRERDDFPAAGDGNPFFHLGMHLTIIEQLRINQPSGIRDAFTGLIARTTDEHQAQHLAMDTLATWLGEGPPHDERVYVERLLSLGKTTS